MGDDENVEALDTVVATTVDSLVDFQSHEKKRVGSVIANSAAEAYCVVVFCKCSAYTLIYSRSIGSIHKCFGNSLTGIIHSGVNDLR